MKKICALVLIALTVIISACTQQGSDLRPLPSSTYEPGPMEDLMQYNSYNLQTYTRPIWQGNVVYNETVLFLGDDDSAPLLYEPQLIIAVLSYDLSVVYDESIDYVLEEGRIKLTENTRIPYFTEKEYYPEKEIPGKTFSSTVPGRPYIAFGEGSTFTSRQIAVTYYHHEQWKGEQPQNQSHKFIKTINKLTNKEEVKILFYGDSITTGANSSSKVGQQPMAETYPQMVTSYLKYHFGYGNIEYINTAVGGKNTAWALQNVQTEVIDYNPDLIFLAFGMNDRITAESYRHGTATLIQTILEKLPDAEIMLISPMLPHSEVSGFYNYQYLFEEQLQTLTTKSIGLAKVTSMHKELLEHKRYRDMTGNNVNHPNDFFARVYAQTILSSLLGI